MARKKEPERPAQQASRPVNDHQRNAIAEGMKVYGWLVDRCNYAKNYRMNVKCASPCHTSLAAAIDQCVGILSNWVFMESGHSYDLMDAMQREADSLVPEFGKLADKWLMEDLP